MGRGADFEASAVDIGHNLGVGQGDGAAARDMLVLTCAVFGLVMTPKLHTLTVAEYTVLEHEPTSLPALTVVDPLAEETAEVRRATIALWLDDAVSVANCRLSARA